MKMIFFMITLLFSQMPANAWQVRPTWHKNSTLQVCYGDLAQTCYTLNASQDAKTKIYKLTKTVDSNVAGESPISQDDFTALIKQFANLKKYKSPNLECHDPVRYHRVVDSKPAGEGTMCFNDTLESHKQFSNWVVRTDRLIGSNGANH